jgi:hypothetical protein
LDLKANFSNITREHDKCHFAFLNYLKVKFQQTWRTGMNKNLTITKLALGIAVAALVISPALAAKKKSKSIYKRSTIYYRAAPVQTYNREPFDYSANGRGLYHNDLLPDGTVTGPIGPDVNGG